MYPPRRYLPTRAQFKMGSVHHSGRSFGIMDPTYPFIPAFSLLSSGLAVMTFATNTHLSRNVPVMCLLIWLFFNGVSRGVNTIVWANDTVNKAPTWCDICMWAFIPRLLR